MIEDIGLKPEEENISFTRREWKYFLDELEMRGLKKIPQCINNARYLAMLDRAQEQSERGEGRLFTWDELMEFSHA